MTNPPRWRCRLGAFVLVALVPLPAAAGPALPATLEPTVDGTAGLEVVRDRLRLVAAAGGWGAIADGPALRLGDRDARVAALRQRLALAGELAGGAVADPELLDGELEQAVRRFQAAHGLETDGVVGPATRAELDVPVGDRIAAIERAIAARRSLPDSLGERFLLLNLPAFELEVHEAGELRLALRVVIGSRARRTPELVSRITGLVLNPYWNVPPAIARAEIVPRLARDPGLLDQLGFRVYRGAPPAQPVDPATIDWGSEAGREPALVLRQEPGPLNALGRVSFQFPNDRNLCLHDTPATELLELRVRALSHGCVRVERPLELARWLLETEPAGTRAVAERSLADGTTRALGLDRPPPIYIVQWNAWIDRDGRPRFRPEVYAPAER